MYVDDFNNYRVQVWTKEGVFVRFIGDASGDGCLNFPVGVFVDEQHVFVTSRMCIKVFTKADGAFIREVKRAATEATSEMQPRCLSISDGVLYVTDTANQCIALFEA